MRRAALIIAAMLSASLDAYGQQQYDPSMYREMRWRMIGPHRASRTKAGVGIADQPNVFYVGYVNGGVWKTTDYGRTWLPIFDDQPTGSVGAIAVAASNPNVVYVGSGEGLQRPDLSTGDGIYKSTDAGKTWTQLGLRDGQQIPMIIVDPRNADRLFVAVLGHPYGPNQERGVFRSTDGGRTFEKVLYKDENTGAIDVQFDPSNPDVIYAALWEQRQAPWENGVFKGPGSGLYKSLDGGSTWRKIGQGLPTGEQGLGRIGLGMAQSQPNRLYAIVGSPAELGGVYRSDDAGENWQRINPDERLWGRDGDFNEIKVDPGNADVAYVANVESWKTTDGGKTFLPFRGAPGGDDPQRFWINPKNPNIILMAGDQGVMISVNGGETWSSWYNQPTAQFYHVTADNAFPYRVCSGQQESGSVCIQSRSDYGGITFREWIPVAAEEYGYVVADPLDPDIVFGGKITRFDRRTRQAIDVSPKLFRSKDYRLLRTAPIVFAPTDPHTLYFASNVVWKTLDRGDSWTRISPDLTRQDSVVPARPIGKYAQTPEARAHHPGVVYTIAPSYRNTNIIWAGSDDGLIHVTFNGGRNWQDVTPAELRSQPWSKVSIMDASHFDTLTAYAAINTLRLDDLRPHIYRTRDGGRTWQHITNGIPDGGTINVVREDPLRRGLLFAGSERAVYVSFDDGDHWQSLRLNMPATSIRDLIIKDNDVVVATHGRSFWILDDITPLRQLTQTVAGAAAHLFTPETAIRFRWNKWPDTPLPPEEPAGENPPDGAIINYLLKAPARQVTLEVLDTTGKLVRRYSSDDPPQKPLEGTNVPPYWPRPWQPLLASAGMHRFVWDMHYPAPAVLEFGYPISAAPHNTPVVPQGVWVMPGRYTVRLTADGKSYEQPLIVKMDPRVQAARAGLAQQFTLSMRVDSLLRADMAALDQTTDASRKTALRQLNGELAGLYDALQSADVAPTTQLVAAVRAKAAELAKLLAPTARGAAQKPGAFYTKQYRNLFVEAGHTAAEAQAKIAAAFRQLFHGDSATQTVYYQAGRNQNGPLAYLTDINNHDVRSEGMSYGMMIAVQMNQKAEFDALWNWSRTYMYHDDLRHPSYGFFSWSLRTDGTPNSEGPAPDGEEYYTMALYFAAARWGNGSGIYNYRAAADRLLSDMKNRAVITGPMARGRVGTEGPEFNAQYKMVRFVPEMNRPDHTDPSYHLPAFYELWARWGPVADRSFWSEAAQVSRDFFQKTTHPNTALAPQYASFDGTPVTNGFNREAGIFGPDSWRTAANWAVDWSWWAADPRERILSDRIQSFFESKGIEQYGNRYTLDGQPITPEHSTALVAANAVAGLAAADRTRALKFVEALWRAEIPEGRYRYYDGMWYLMGLLHCAGQFRIWTPSSS